MPLSPPRYSTTWSDPHVNVPRAVVLRGSSARRNVTLAACNLASQSGTELGGPTTSSLVGSRSAEPGLDGTSVGTRSTGGMAIDGEGTVGRRERAAAGRESTRGGPNPARGRAG